MKNSKYDNFKPFWKHANPSDGALINKLEVDPVTKNVLHSIKKQGNALFYKDKNGKTLHYGLPSTLELHIGRVPEISEVMSSIKELVMTYKFIEKTGQETKPREKGLEKTFIYFDVDMKKIKEWIGSQSSNSLF